MKKIWRMVRWPLAIIVLCVAYFEGLQYTGNFHEVIPGELYRSAQPVGGDIEVYQKRYGIRTVINLRGKNTGKDWYDNEIIASRAAGVEHVDFRVSVKQEMTPEEAHSLIEIMRHAQKPLLIHCHAGADRVGLATALYQLAIAHQPPNVAGRQLSARYGHWPIPFYGMLPLPFTDGYLMDQSWRNLQDVIVEDGSKTP